MDGIYLSIEDALKIQENIATLHSLLLEQHSLNPNSDKVTIKDDGSWMVTDMELMRLSITTASALDGALFDAIYDGQIPNNADEFYLEFGYYDYDECVEWNKDRSDAEE